MASTATSQENSYEAKVLKKFLPEMKRLLNLEELNLYLISEEVVGDDDIPKLTVSTGHITKSQALIHLHQIILGRGTFEHFLTALNRSSADHPGHKELHSKMIEERSRRMSNTGIESITATNPLSELVTLVEPGEEVTSSETTAQQLQVDAPTQRNVTIEANSSNAMVAGSTQCQNSTQERHSGRDEKQISKLQRQSKRQGLIIGIVIGGLTTIGITLVALAMTSIIYGSLGIQGKDKCGYNNATVSAFDITSGAIIILLLFLTFLCLYTCIRKTFYKGDDNYILALLIIPAILFGIFCGFAVIANYLFSFIAIVKEVYVTGANTNGCKSPAFTSAFAYVTTEFIIIFLAVALVGSILYERCKPAGRRT